MTTIPAFTHHTINLLPSPIPPDAAGGKSHLSAVNEACKNAERIQRVLKMEGRVEVAMISPDSDFFGTDPKMVKPRKLAWQLMSQIPHVRCLLLTTQPENIRGSLPADWRGKGYANVGIGVVADHADGLEEKLATLRSVSARWRMLLLHSMQEPVDLNGKLGGIDWVVFVGTAADHGGGAVRDACREAGIAFLWLDADCASSFHNMLANSGQDTPEHPFGAHVQLRRPTLRGIESPTQLVLALSSVDSPPPAIQVPVASPVLAEPATTLFDATTVLPDVIADAAGDAIPIATVETEQDEVVVSIQGSPMGEAELLDVVVVVDDDVITVIVEPELDPSQPPLRCGVIPFDTCDAGLAEFIRLDEIVQTGVKASLLAGAALRQIRDGKLWAVGGFANWNAYCEDARNLSKQYVNRLIKAASVMECIHQVETIVSTLTAIAPQNEGQVKELYPLKDPEKQAAAWRCAVERTNGQPTAKALKDIVAELMADYAVTLPKADLTPIKSFIKHLRAEIMKAPGERDTDGLLFELTTLLKSV